MHVVSSTEPVAPVVQLVTSKRFGWDVSSNLGAITRTGIFTHKKIKNTQQVKND